MPKPTPVAQLGAAFDNYFAVSDVLTKDVDYMLDHDDSESQSFRRMYIRNLVSLLEGVAHCYRDILQLSKDQWPYYLTEQEIRVLNDERGLAAPDRLKLTLRAMFKMMELDAIPDFGTENWAHAQATIRKRDAISHPKSEVDLHVGDDIWIDGHTGLVWLIQQFFSVMELIKEKHGGGR